MKKRDMWMIGLVLLLMCVGVGLGDAQDDKDTLFQVSTIDALMQGAYEGTCTIERLKQHGGFGIGTLHALDGELIVLDGEVYQVKVDGSVHKVDDTTTTPFANITCFETDRQLPVIRPLKMEELKTYLDTNLPFGKNSIYAIRIDGFFNYVKTRSVPAQEKPYLPLAEVAKHQSVFEFRNIQGTIVGFRCPEYVKGVNATGYHFHFINQTRNAGGHLLDCELKTGKIFIDTTTTYEMILPVEELVKLDLSKDQTSALQAVETGVDQKK